MTSIIVFHPEGGSLSQPTETLFVLPYNQSVRIKSAGNNQTTSDAGALLMRKVIEKTGLIAFLTARLHDPRGQSRIKHPLALLLLQLSQGWRT